MKAGTATGKPRWRRAAAAGAAAVLAGAGAWTALRPRMLGWGATKDEQERPLPGDWLIPDPLYASTRAITIEAPAAAVWPWLVQIGHDRGGFYSYDALENMMGLEVHSAAVIRPEWQDLTPGEDFITLDPDGSMKLTVAILDRDSAFVLRSGSPEDGPQPPGDMIKGEMAWTWGFYLDAIAPERTRLLIRSRAAWTDTCAARAMRYIMLEPVHFLMEERMLRGIRDRALRILPPPHARAGTPA